MSLFDKRDSAMRRRTLRRVGVLAARAKSRPAEAGPVVDRNDELIHRLDFEIAADERELLVRVAPPLHDMWLLQPIQHQRKVGRGHGAELVAADGGCWRRHGLRIISSAGPSGVTILCCGSKPAFS